MLTVWAIPLSGCRQQLLKRIDAFGHLMQRELPEIWASADQGKQTLKLWRSRTGALGTAEPANLIARKVAQDGFAADVERRLIMVANQLIGFERRDDDQIEPP